MSHIFSVEDEEPELYASYPQKTLRTTSATSLCENEGASGMPEVQSADQTWVERSWNRLEAIRNRSHARALDGLSEASASDASASMSTATSTIEVEPMKLRVRRFRRSSTDYVGTELEADQSVLSFRSTGSEEKTGRGRIRKSSTFCLADLERSLLQGGLSAFGPVPLPGAVSPSKERSPSKEPFHVAGRRRKSSSYHLCDLEGSVAVAGDGADALPPVDVPKSADLAKLRRPVRKATEEGGYGRCRHVAPTIHPLSYKVAEDRLPALSLQGA